MQPEPVRAGPTVAPPAMALELGPVVTKLSTSLGGAVPVERIEQVLRDLLEQEFSEARVTSFLPIFLHRYAIETLRHGPTGDAQGGLPAAVDAGRAHG